MHSGHRAWLGTCLAPMVLLLVTACTSSSTGNGSAPVGATATSSSTGAAIPGLPGDEALTPPPPDPDAADWVRVLSTLPVGPLAGSLELSVSGLVAFAETTSGECRPGVGSAEFAATLSDGSTLVLTADSTGLSSSLRAPGVEAEHTLTDVQVSGSSPVLVSGDLLTAGTSEPAGSLRWEFSCG